MRTHVISTASTRSRDTLVYVPILKELEAFDIRFVESETTL